MSKTIDQTSSSIVDLERRRLLLEQNVVKFRDYVKHWRTWEAEYEGFKEEILALEDDHTNDGLKLTGSVFGGTFLTEKEIGLLLDDKSGRKRSRDQVVGLLNRRIDYVQSNIQTLENNLKHAEEQAAASLLDEAKVQDLEGLPMAEIREELDEKGNVLSSSITTPNDAPPKILETLRMAGVELPEPDFGSTDGSTEEANLEATNVESSYKNKSTIEAQDQYAGSQPIFKPTVSDPPSERTVIEKPLISRKKSVTFAEGTKKEDSTISKRQSLPFRPRSEIAPRMRLGDNTSKGERLDHCINADTSKPSPAFSTIDAKSNNKSGNSEPFSAVMPANESPEDAALRRQMIKYNMEEIGSIVAELDIEEDSDFGSDDGSEEDDQAGSSIDEDEDEFGRTKHRVIDDKYRREMLALEKKLSDQFIRNIGPEAGAPELLKNGLSAKVESENQSYEGLQDSKTPPTKEVRFADQLKIHGVPSFTPFGRPGETAGKVENSRLDTPVAERAASSIDRSENPSTKKVSRFKRSRNGSILVDGNSINPHGTLLATASKPPIASTVIERSALKITSLLPATSLPSIKKSTPSGPHASTIIEHPYSRSTNAPSEPDDLDPSLLYQQVATEYHHMRNRMIQRQGGFLASAEEEANHGRVELTEEGAERKVSRFKAARLKMR